MKTLANPSCAKCQKSLKPAKGHEGYEGSTKVPHARARARCLFAEVFIPYIPFMAWGSEAAFCSEETLPGSLACWPSGILGGTLLADASLTANTRGGSLDAVGARD